MRPTAFVLLAIASGASLAACESKSHSTAGDDGELIGGRVAEENEFPATIQIKGNCTAAKVGPRQILFAAHCASQRAGDIIEISSAKLLGTFADGPPTYTAYRVESVALEPGWLKTCGQYSEGCQQIGIIGDGKYADAAVLTVTEDITDIPEAAVDLSPVVDSDEVVITGYGCEDRVGGRWTYEGARLKVATTRTIPFEETIHSGSYITEIERENGQLEIQGGIYSITPGPAHSSPMDARTGAGSDGGTLAKDAGDTEVAGLCPGDSGGPLYRAGGDSLTIVGVNASYTFGPANDGMPVTNWHTRLDGKTGLKVGAWLASLGVRTVCTRGGC